MMSSKYITFFYLNYLIPLRINCLGKKEQLFQQEKEVGILYMFFTGLNQDLLSLRFNLFWNRILNN